MLTAALITSHDATVNYWDGKPTTDPRPHSSQLVSYLSEVRKPLQAQILDCHLRSRIAVIPDVSSWHSTVTGKATLVLDGQAIAQVARPCEEYFQQDLDWLRAYSDLRSDRMSEIFHQTGDLLSFFGALGHLDNGRREYTLLLLVAVRGLAAHLQVLAKFAGRQKRPIDYAMQLQPMIQTPDHSSFPSGHAVEAFAIATVLNRLSEKDDAAKADPKGGVTHRTLPFVLAHRIATNRTVAGVHFPVDSLAGAFYGCALGDTIYRLAKGVRPLDDGVASLTSFERYISLVTDPGDDGGDSCDGDTQSAQTEDHTEQAPPPLTA